MNTSSPLEFLDEASGPSHKKSTFRTIIISIVAVAVLAVAVGTYFAIRPEPERVAETPLGGQLAENEFAANGVADIPLGGTLLPQVRDVVTMPAPQYTAEVTAADRAAYDALMAAWQEGELDSPVGTMDSPYHLNIDGLDFLTVVEALDSRDVIMRIHDELIAHVIYLNNSFKASAPVERGAASTVTAPYEDAASTVYPSKHVVLASLVGDVLIANHPAAAESIRYEVEQMQKRGITYGLYSASDMEASIALYEQFKGELTKQHAEAASLISVGTDTEPVSAE